MLHLNHTLLFILLLSCTVVKAQTNFQEKNRDKSGVFYIAFGTNLSFYSKSDITLKSTANPVFNFTLQNVRGKDDGGLNFNHGAPQYGYQLGYYSYKKNWGVEFNFDHIKYYVRQLQRVRLQGTINGHAYDTDTLINPYFVQLEHTDGANYALLKWVKWKSLLEDKRHEKTLFLLLKAGAGPVIPKTNSTIMGKHRDDRYHIAGYVIAIESGLRYNFSKSFFTEVNAKGAYADYNHILIANGSGSQHWFGLHLALLVGLQLNR
jgi:hypothetical protein